MNITNGEIEHEIISFIDTCKDFLSPSIWNNLLLDCSKNEVLVLWLLYRNHEVNMSQIAEYIHVPLNTATGIIARMEKKKLIHRQHSATDKRVVTIGLSELGQEQIQSIINEATRYIVQLAASFTPEEMNVIFRMISKLQEIMKNSGTPKEEKPKGVRKIIIE